MIPPKLRHIIPAVLILLIICFIASAGPAKNTKNNPVRNTESDTTGTSAVQVVFGSGDGVHEEILGETFVFAPDSLNDWYSVYMGFLGLTFAEDTGKVHQTRYTDNSFNVDGELNSVIPVSFNSIIEGLYISSGQLNDITFGHGDTTFEVNIYQQCYIRSDSSDQFFILEYYLSNWDSTEWLTDGKFIFFLDIDVGNSIFDNLTGRDESRRMIYQYSPSDDYCGMALLTPEIDPCYGNFNAWYFNGTDAMIDSITAYPVYDESFDINSGDRSVYLVVDIGDLPPNMYYYKTVAFVFALGHDLNDLNNQIDAGRTLYFGSINSVPPVFYPQEFGLLKTYPNPFNSSLYIELKLPASGYGSMKIFDILGRELDVIHEGFLQSGVYNFSWNANSASSINCSSGIYFLKVVYPGFTKSEKIIFLK